MALSESRRHVCNRRIQSGNHMKILIVDPDRSGYDSLLQAAATRRYEVCFLATGRDALRQRREMLAGLVMVNVVLPDFSGFEVVEMLRPFPKGGAVFLVADQYAVEDELRALELGIGSYLYKPLDGSVLYECRATRRAVIRY
jgi:DNA-binding response OmpR family regulator